MRALTQSFLIVGLLLFNFTGQAFAVKQGEIKKTFKNVESVRIKTVSGNCIIEKGSTEEVKVIVTFSYRLEGVFEPELEQRGSRLLLTERFRSRRGSSHGRSTWHLTVPEKTDIDFSTASGDLDIEGLNSTIEAKTASGKVSLSNMTGEFDVSTASGDVEARGLHGMLRFSTASGDVDLSNSDGKLKISTASGRIRSTKVAGEINLSTASGEVTSSDCSGEFEVSTASGDVDASGVVVKDHSSFNAASGDVEIELGKKLEHDLKISTASGDARLNFNNYPIQGYIEITAKARRGRIRAPFKFDNEEHYTKWGDDYVTKSVTRGSDRPAIVISTASGQAVLQEK